MTNTTKPEFMQPCNHCGICCELEACGVSIELGSSVAPCVWLSPEKKCMVVEEEAKLVAEGLVIEGPIIAEALGIGKGCCSELDDGGL